MFEEWVDDEWAILINESDYLCSFNTLPNHRAVSDDLKKKSQIRGMFLNHGQIYLYS